MAEVNVDVKPRGTASAYVAAPFDVAKEQLAEAGYRFISLQENARLRMQEGKDAFISRNGNYVREGVLYVPQKGTFLTRSSPIMVNATEATNCHRNGKEFYLTDAQVEQGLVGSVELKAGAIPVNRFGEDAVTVYAFGDDAQKYGDFLKEAKINEMPVWLASVGDKAFARQMWFGCLGSGSGLYGSDWLLDCGRVRGVQDSAEGTVAKKVEVYTVGDIKKALKTSNLTGIEQVLIESLRQ